VNIVIMLRNIETITSDIQTKLSVVTGQVDALSRSAEEVKQRYLQANNDSKDVKKKKAEVQNMPARTPNELILYTKLTPAELNMKVQIAQEVASGDGSLQHHLHVPILDYDELENLPARVVDLFTKSPRVRPMYPVMKSNYQREQDSDDLRMR
jgi:hypothetical protein